LSSRAMPTLASYLTDPAKRDKVLDDCVRLVDDEVGDKGGLSGMGIKAAYAIVKKIKPGFVRNAMNGMLDDFAKNLDPIFQEHLAKGSGSLVDHMVSKKGQ